MPRTVALSTDEQRALEYAVGEVNNAVAHAHSSNPATDSAMKKKKKKKRSRDEANIDSDAGVTEEGSARKKIKKKRPESDDIVVVPPETTQDSCKQSKKERHKEKERARQVELGREKEVQGETEREMEMERQRQQALEVEQMPPASSITERQKKKKKDKGKRRQQPAIEETTAPGARTADVAPTLGQAYTTPHALMSALFSTAPTLPHAAPEPVTLEQMLLSQGFTLPQDPAHASYHMQGDGHDPQDTSAVLDLNQLMADLNTALGLPATEEPAASSSSLPANVPSDEFLRILEALQNLDSNKIPGVLKTLNDAATQNPPQAHQQPAHEGSSGVPVSIPAPGALPFGHERAPLLRPPYIHPRLQVGFTPPNGPAPYNQVPVSSTLILGSQGLVPSGLVLGAGHNASAAHAHMLANKWLSSAQLAELVKKEGTRHS